jgi:hemerythrin-like domain-containing protein
MIMDRPSASARCVERWQFDGFEALDLCHRETLRMLKELDALVDRLGDIGADDRARSTAGTIERHFSETVAAHHADEERHLFPALWASGDAGTRQVLARLRQDHAWMDVNWRSLQPQLDALARGHCSFDPDLFRDGSRILAALVRDHILLEESLVYPEAKRRLTDRDRAGMNSEMASRRRAPRRMPAPRSAGARG